MYAQEQGGFGSQEQAAKDQDDDDNDGHHSPDEGVTANNEGVDGEVAENSESDSASVRGNEDSEAEADIRTRDRENESEIKINNVVDPGLDPKLQDLLKENEGETEEEGDDREGRSRDVDKGKDKLELRSRKKGKPSWRRDDMPAGTIAVLVYACWTMRVPVIYQDFIRRVVLFTL